MPSMEESKKKSKKSKKNKTVVAEEEEEEVTMPIEEEVEEDDTETLKDEVKQIIEEGVTEDDEESPKKKKKKKKSEDNGNENLSNFSDEDSINKAVKSLGEVSEELIEQFRSVAEKASKKNKGDSIGPLAAAIAILSGATRVATLSILTGRDGFTTYKLTKYDDEIRGKSFAFVILKKILGEEEGDAAISHIKFTADRKSLVFDIPSSYDEMIAQNWQNTKSLELEPLVGELPALEEGGDNGGGGGGRGRGGDRGRGRGGGGGGGDGCFKCGEKGHFSRECPTGGGGGGGGDGCFKCGEKGHFSRECPSGGGGGRGRGGFGGGRGRGGFGGRGGGGGRGRGGGFGEKRSFGGGGGGDFNNKKIKFDDE